MHGWVLVGYQDKNTLKIVGTGTGDSQELAKKIVDNDIMYAVVRVQAMNKDVSEGRSVFIRFLGPNISTLQRGQKNSHIGAVKEVMSHGRNTKGELECLAPANMNDKVIVSMTDPGNGNQPDILKIFLNLFPKQDPTQLIRLDIN